MAYSYQKIADELLSQANERTRDILVSRFGLESREPLTLEAIGQKHGITRERVRQIIEDGLLMFKEDLASRQKHASNATAVFSDFYKVLGSSGYAKREDLFIDMLKANEESSYVVFLLHLDPRFYRYRETEEFYPFWVNKPELALDAPKIHKDVVERFERQGTLLSDSELKKILQGVYSSPSSSFKTLLSLLEASKQVKQAYNKRWGLMYWPEVNPKGVREKAYIVLKDEGHPLHFREITGKIQELQHQLPVNPERMILSQTVHNELIKDPRFILIGRGTYALSDWGYEPGTVKDMLISILKDANSDLSKEDLISRILSKRQVKESTILLNLQDKRMFQRTPEGGYILRS